MKGKRCQICDGPIANGRCTLCGMPYRDDEVLYHLNESRSDHYRHATEQARKKMREQEQQAAGSSTVSAKKHPSREEMKEHQQQVRKAAIERMSNTKVKQVRTYGGDRKAKTGSKNKVSKLSVTLTVLIVMFGIIPGIFVHLKSTYETRRLNSAFSTEIEEPGISEWKDGDTITYYLKEGYEAEVGVDLPEGSYIFYVTEGSATVQVTSTYRTENHGIADEVDVQFIYLKKGDLVSVRDLESSHGQVKFELIEEV